MIYIIKYILLIHVQYQKFMGTVIAYKNEKNYKEAHTMFAKIAISYHVHNSYSLTFPGYQFCCRDINIMYPIIFILSVSSTCLSTTLNHSQDMLT